MLTKNLKKKKNKIINLPNFITLLGLIIVNYSLIMFKSTQKSIYLVYMVIGCLCDYLDGYFARKFKIESNFGNFLDKIVDKFNQSFILFLIIKLYNESWSYLVLYALREIIILLSRCFNLKSSKSSFHGKLKTFIFPLSIILYHYNHIDKKIFLNFLTIFNFITLIL
jgi:CDP-diacylglycerol--glycerol-3-phosphate 3-phosphatidyltransferase